MNKKIIYIQYTNPACYPALEHSSHIMADRGWEVLFLGTGTFGQSDVIEFPQHPNISVRKVPFCPRGLKQKLHYVRFFIWSILRVFRRRTDWIYASDPLSCPIALFLNYAVKTKVLYHEHDSPDFTTAEQSNLSYFMRFVLWTRKELGRRSDIVILPNHGRLEHFKKITSRTKPVFCVWNCPSVEDVKPPVPGDKNKERLVLHYHGTLNGKHLPFRILEAMSMLPQEVHLKVFGYETTGSQGYIDRLRKEVSRLAIESRVTFLPTAERKSVMEHCASSDVGLALIPQHPDDANHKNMVGASNKTFEYMACGLALLVSDLADWRKAYVETGYGLSCDPDDPESIAEAVRWFMEHRIEMRSMGERGRQKVLDEWNYEKQFERILEIMK